jgi:hypothetical protein
MKNKIIIALASIIIIFVIIGIIVYVKQNKTNDDNVQSYIDNNYSSDNSDLIFYDYKEDDGSSTDAEITYVQTANGVMTKADYDDKWREIYGDYYKGLYGNFIFVGSTDSLDYDKENVMSILSQYGITSGIIMEYYADMNSEEPDLIVDTICEEEPEFTSGIVWTISTETDGYILYQYNGDIRVIVTDY